MRTANKPKRTRDYNGFAIPLERDTELGLAILIVEDEEGNTQPIGVVATINEAQDCAKSDFAARRRRLKRDEDPGPLSVRLQAVGAGYRRRL
jgi:hypothetical protein